MKIVRARTCNRGRGRCRLVHRSAAPTAGHLSTGNIVADGRFELTAAEPNEYLVADARHPKIDVVNVNSRSIVGFRHPKLLHSSREDAEHATDPLEIVQRRRLGG